MRKCLSVLRQFVNKINYSQTSHNFRSFRNFATKVNDSFAIHFYRTKHPIFNRKIYSLFFKLMGVLQLIPAAAYINNHIPVQEVFYPSQINGSKIFCKYLEIL